MGRGRRIAPRTREEIADLYRAGQPTAEIARAFGIRPWSVIQIAREAGVPIRGGHTPSVQPVQLAEQLPPLDSTTRPRKEGLVIKVDSTGTVMETRRVSEEKPAPDRPKDNAGWYFRYERTVFIPVRNFEAAIAEFRQRHQGAQVIDVRRKGD